MSILECSRKMTYKEQIAFDLGYNKSLFELNQQKQRITELEQRLEKSVELPCKVGDTVYVLIQRNATIEIVKGTVKNIQHSCNAWWVEFSDLWVDKMFDDFGKTVFLTREEAEQALKGGADDE